VARASPDKPSISDVVHAFKASYSSTISLGMDMLDTHVSGSSAVSPALLVVHEDLIMVVEVVVKTLSRKSSGR
jgi:hypothetical protein